jgi:hypothetical protein
MTTTSIETIADVAIPDTPLVRAITEHIREAEDDLLFDHSRRVFLFGALQGRCCASRSTAPTRPESSC